MCYKKNDGQAKMKPIRKTLLALLLLSACGGNPFVDTTTDPGTTPGGGGTTPPPVDETNGVTVAGTVNASMKSVTYAANNSAPIQVNMTALDAANLNGSYVRNSAFDVGSYKAYTHQETGSNRYVVALVKDDFVDAQAMIAMEAGQFGESHSGGLYSRVDVFTKPTPSTDVGAQNKFNYSGTYAGLVNFGDAPAGGPGGALDPTRAYRTTGRVLITADFVDMKVTGGIDNRSVVDTGDPLASVFMEAGGTQNIDAKGNFGGKITRVDVETDAQGNVTARLNEAGDYAGIFAGADASVIAALYVFKPIKGNDIAYEQGIFMAQDCVTAGGPACP